MSALTTPIPGERPPHPAARLDQSAPRLTGTAGAEELVVLPAVPVSGFCAQHLLPFVGRVQVAQLPGSKFGALRTMSVRRATHELCASPQHPGKFASSLADWLERLPGGPSLVIKAELRPLCSHCSLVDPRYGAHRSLAVRGEFRLRPDLAEGVLLLLQGIGRNPSPLRP